MDASTLYMICTSLGTVIFGLVFFNYYLGACKEEEEEEKAKAKKD